MLSPYLFFSQDRKHLGATSTSSGPTFWGLENPRPFPEGSPVLPLPQNLFRYLLQKAEGLSTVHFLLGFSSGSLQPCLACCSFCWSTVSMDTPFKEAAVPNFPPNEIASSLCHQPPFYNTCPDLPLAQVWPGRANLSLSHLPRAMPQCQSPSKDQFLQHSMLVQRQIH